MTKLHNLASPLVEVKKTLSSCCSLLTVVPSLLRTHHTNLQRLHPLPANDLFELDNTHNDRDMTTVDNEITEYLKSATGTDSFNTFPRIKSNVFILPFLHQLISQSAVQKLSLKPQTASNAGVEARWL